MLLSPLLLCVVLVATLTLMTAAWLTSRSVPTRPKLERDAPGLRTQALFEDLDLQDAYTLAPERSVAQDLLTRLRGFDFDVTPITDGLAHIEHQGQTYKLTLHEHAASQTRGWEENTTWRLGVDQRVGAAFGPPQDTPLTRTILWALHRQLHVMETMDLRWMSREDVTTHNTWNAQRYPFGVGSE